MPKPSSAKATPAGTNAGALSPQAPQTSFQRWYDADPLLLEVLNLMALAPQAAVTYAQRLIDGVEAKVENGLLQELYAKIEAPDYPKNRWYDSEPALRKALELLRLMPPEAQRVAAHQFIDALEADQGVSYRILKATFAAADEAACEQELAQEEAATSTSSPS